MIHYDDQGQMYLCLGGVIYLWCDFAYAGVAVMYWAPRSAEWEEESGGREVDILPPVGKKGETVEETQKKRISTCFIEQV